MKNKALLFIAGILFIAVLTSSSTCNKATANNKCFKGRLEIKGICMNYVIKVLEGNTKNLNIAKTWTDETNNKVYQNVFALGNKCNFPDLKEGEEFYFTIQDKPDHNCMVCEAYRPVPAARNNITVSKTPCP